MHILRLAALPLALGLALSACLDPDAITSSIPTASTTVAGGVAFHLSGADSLALVGKADSVRIEATRTGYPTHSVSGSLLGTTRLSDLEPGLWNLRIALYDASLAIRWAGDTTVNISSGTTSDAVVRLRPATGSVNVRIVLDSIDSVITFRATLRIDSAQWDNASNWGTQRTWRTADGIHFFGTSYVCGMIPKVRLASIQPIHNIVTAARQSDVILNPIPLVQTVHAFPDSSMLVLGLDDRRAVSSCVSIESQQRSLIEFFIPWTRRGPVTLHTSTGDVLLPDPAFPGTVTDSSAISYTYSISGFMPTATSYTMDASGNVKSLSTQQKGIGYDTLPIISMGTLSPDSLAIALSILQSAAVRHPVPLIEHPVADSNGLVMGCPTDAPYYSRKISYAGGTSADLSWSFSDYCGALPAGWKDLNRVDDMLQSLLPALTRAIPTAVNDGANQ